MHLLKHIFFFYSLFYKWILVLAILAIIIGYLFSWKIGLAVFILPTTLLFLYPFFLRRKVSKIPEITTIHFFCRCGKKLKVDISGPSTGDYFLDEEGKKVCKCPSCGRDLDKEWERSIAKPFGRGNLKDGEILLDDPEMEDLAEAIVRIADPLLRQYPHQFHQIIDTAIWAWNLSLLPKERQAKEKKRAVEALKKAKFGPSRNCKDALSFLLARKKSYYSKNKSILLRHSIQKKGDTYEITVESDVEFDIEVLMETLKKRG